MSADLFAKQRAVDLSLTGRYSLANWYDQEGRRREFACRATRMNPFRMLVSVPVVGKVGERVTSYFGEFGHLNGWITDTVAGGFLLDLDADKALREQLARQLAWLERKKNEAIEDIRDNARSVPKEPHSTLVFADGTYRSCFIINMSVSGAAVSADVQPPLGTPLSVGACVGRVVRHFAEGFAVRFITRQDPGRLERLIVRSTAWVARSTAASIGQDRTTVILEA